MRNPADNHDPRRLLAASRAAAAAPVAAADPTERELLERYIAAFEDDDIEGPVSLLREDASMRMPPQRVLVGGPAIARFLRDVPGRVVGLDAFIDPALPPRFGLPMRL